MPIMLGSHSCVVFLWMLFYSSGDASAILHILHATYVLLIVLEVQEHTHKPLLSMQ